MALCSICYFIVTLLFFVTLYWEKVTSFEKFNHNSKLHGKFQRFNAIDGTIEMLKNG